MRKFWGKMNGQHVEITMRDLGDLRPVRDELGNVYEAYTTEFYIEITGSKEKTIITSVLDKKVAEVAKDAAALRQAEDFAALEAHGIDPQSLQEVSAPVDLGTPHVETWKCKHENFGARVNVNRLTDSGRFMADVTVGCRDCGTRFQFLGLEPGIDTGGSRVSIDGQEARLAICPAGDIPSPLQRMAFNIGKFDGRTPGSIPSRWRARHTNLCRPRCFRSSRHPCRTGREKAATGRICFLTWKAA